MLSISRSFAFRFRIWDSRGFQTNKRSSEGNSGHSLTKLPSRSALFFGINHGFLLRLYFSNPISLMLSLSHDVPNKPASGSSQ
jgi:hypothetical protein